MSMLVPARFLPSSKARPPAPEEDEAASSTARTPAGGGDYSDTTTTRSRLGSVRQQCDIFSITNDPASEFEEAPAPVPASVRFTWRALAALSLMHTVLLLVNVVLLFNVDNRERKSHQQVLLFSLLMLTNIVVCIVMVLVVVRQNKALTQCAICCTFWTSFAYFVVLAYNSLDDPLSLCAGRTCLAVVVLSMIELAALAVYFVLRFIRYKKVVELYNCRACTCDKNCAAAAKDETRLSFADLWPRSEDSGDEPHRAAGASHSSAGSHARESPISDPYALPSTHYM